MRTLHIFAFLALAASTAAPASSKPKPALLRGTIVSATSTTLVVRTASGSKAVSFGPKMRFLGIRPSSLAKVTDGAFIGTAVVPRPDGTFTSTEVHIFAPSLRGTGEGFTKMDSQGKRMMANSTVRSVETPSRMMANSTVRSVNASAAGKTITLVFKSGKKVITIPPATPIVYIEPGSKALLMRGAHVLVVAVPAESGLIAKTLLVGEHGTVPPM